MLGADLVEAAVQWYLLGLAGDEGLHGAQARLIGGQAEALR